MGLRVRGVLLDLDGTLLDHDGAAREAFFGAYREWITPVVVRDDEEALAIWKRLEVEYMRYYLSGELSFQEQRRGRVRSLLDEYGVDTADLRADGPDGMFGQYLRLYEASWRSFYDVREAMDFFWNAPCGVAILSNGDRGQQLAKLRALRLPRDPPLFVPADTGAPKPDPLSFLSACRSMGWSPGSTLYVGDDLANDALAAKRAGLLGCWLDRSNSAWVAEVGEILKVSNLLQLKGVVEWL